MIKVRINFRYYDLPYQEAFKFAILWGGIVLINDQPDTPVLFEASVMTGC